MKCKLLVLSSIFMLCACGKSSNSVQVVLDDGTKLNVNGTLVKEYKKTSADGTLKVNNFIVEDNPIEAEEAISKEFKRLGYRRKIIEKPDGVYKVHYYKQDRPVVGSTFTVSKEPAVSGVRVSIYWKI